jgi:putative endonuclease
MRRRGRAQAERHGRHAEHLAALNLMLAGFSIVARRFKAAGGELDLVARRGTLLVLAEVKARRTLDDALLAVTPQTRRRIEAAGRMFIARHPGFAAFSLRYDVVAVAGWRVRRVADAWREGD